jgi:glutamyl-tRNA synthetase
MKTRFAPSPTGYLHVGGLRTALYNFLLAKKEKGTFILRIEDTDQTRKVEGAKENLIETLKWCGLEWNEGPYIQSERFDLYKEHARKLIESNHAYHCFCTKERLDEMRAHQEASHQAPMYDRKCLYLSKEEVEEKLANGEPHVIRQKIPYETLKFKDEIRGKVQFEGKQIDDQVLIKSDGFPTYHLANVVDDHLMGITHVIRGEEWLPSTPKHIWLYRAFGWDPPKFAHIPLLLNTDRSKLSKRQGHVSVEEFIKDGVEKEALINFIAFLGWHPGGDDENEIYTLEELVKKFSLEKVHKAGAVFDLDKLAWFCWQWRRRKFLDELEKYAKELDPKVKIEEEKKGHFKYHFENEENLEKLLNKKAGLLLEIGKGDIPEEWQKDLGFFNKCILTVEEKILRDPKTTKESMEFYFVEKSYEKELLTHEKMKVDLEMAKKSLTTAKEALEKLENFGETEIKETLFKTVEELGVKNGQVLWPFRAATTGEKFSPGAFEVAYALGKEKTLERLEKALAMLG